MEAKDLAKQEVREAITSEITKEGLFELKEETIRGNKYNVYTNAPKNLRDFFQFGLMHGEWNFIAYENEQYSYQESLDKSA